MRGLLNYLSQKDGAVLLSTNLDGDTPRTFACQFGHVRRLHPRETVDRPVCHIPLRPAPGEDLTDAQWAETVDLTLEAMGFQDSPYVAYLHDHGDGRHLHIATYRVNFHGRLVSDSFDRLKVMAVARQLEAKFGLSVPEPRRETPLTRAELERRLRDPERANHFDALRLAIDQAASQSDTLRHFLTELHRLGVEANLKVARHGKLQGITFRLPDDSVVKGSNLGKRYSLASICNRHELRLDNKADGPLLVASEVTRAELRMLSDVDLAPDHVSRSADRNTVYWTLPPGRERWFADLVALHLPHRFIDFTEALPVESAQTVDLDARARKADLLEEVAQSPLPITLSLSLADDRRRPQEVGLADTSLSYSDLAQRLDQVSTALQAGPDLLSEDASELRASYREAMQRLLAIERSGVAPDPSPSVRSAPHHLETSSIHRMPPAQSFTGELPVSVNLERAQDPTSAPEQPSSGARGTDAILALQAAYQEDPSIPRYREWARHVKVSARPSAPPLLVGAHAEQDSAAVREALSALATDLLAAHDRYVANPSPHHHADWRTAQAAYERLARRLDSLPVRSLPPDRRPTPSMADLCNRLLDAQDRHLADPTPASEAEWRRARLAFQSAVATQPPLTAPPSPDMPRSSVNQAHCELHLAEAQLGATERAYLNAPRDRGAQATWLSALEGVQQARAELVSAYRAELAVLGRDLRQRASDLAFYEAAHFRSPSPVSEKLWRQAEASHLRAAITYEDVHLKLTNLLQEQPSRPHRLDHTTRAAARLLERQALEPDADRLRRLTLRTAQSLWAQTPVGRTLVAAAHPLRAAVRQLPGSAAVLSAASLVSETAQRSLAIYAELRAASDRARSRKVPRGRRTLEQGDLSTPSLARAVVAARVASAPISFSTLPQALKASRASEAALLRSFRSYQRGLTSHEALLATAGRSLATRAAVTERIHLSLGLPAFRDIHTVLGAAKAAPVWIKALEQAGFSARAIAVSVAEAAPLAAASGAAALAFVAARRAVRWTLHQFRNAAHEILRDQNDERR